MMMRMRFFLKVSHLAALLLFFFNTIMANYASDDGGPGVYDVRQYGAKGDGKNYDGDAIQQAIDACSRNGGGRVLLHDGLFVSGGIVLRDNVDFHLSASAELIAHNDVTRLNHDDKFKFKNTICSFIYADGARNIAITGAGKINGNGTAFGWEVYSERPQLILLRSCQDVRIRDVFITNSGMFNLWMIQCDRVKIDGIRILSLQTPNNDGIGIDGSSNVTIANCNLNTLDDCIAFKNSDIRFSVRNVVITNCILSSRCAAIRLGPDASSDIENVAVSNCVITNTGLNGIKIQEPLGATMRNLVFSNIVMDNVKGPISIRLSGWDMGPYTGLWTSFSDSNWRAGKLEHVLFENIRATVPRAIEPVPELAAVPEGWLNLTNLNSGIHITGTAHTRPRHITFSNIDISFAGGGTAEQAARRQVPDLEQDYPEMYMFGELPAYGLYMHHVSGVILNNVRFTLDSADLRPAIVCSDVDDLEINGFSAMGDQLAESLIRLENSKNIYLFDSRPLNKVNTFVRIEGADSENIHIGKGRFKNKYDRLVETAAGARSRSVIRD